MDRLANGGGVAAAVVPVDSGTEKSQRRLSMTMRNRFKEVEEEWAEADDAADGMVFAPQLTHSEAAAMLQQLLVPKKSGHGERKLTVREQLLLRSLVRAPAERSEDDISLIVRAVSAAPPFCCAHPISHPDG